MIKIKQWLILIIAVSVSAGIIDILLPAGKTKKTFRVVSGIVMLYVFLIPLKNVDGDKFLKSFTFDSRGAEESLQSQYDMTVISAYKKGIENILSESFRNENIKADEIDVICKSENNEVIIQKISVSVKQINKDTENKIRKIISEKISGIPEIEIIGR